MISVSRFYSALEKQGVSFFTGVPDSLLKNICAYISDNASGENHIIAANEGGAISLAVGYHLATGRIPLVYLQNSGIGNAVNPLMSLADKEVYQVPLILLIGWRGEPGVKDEPQHIKQGRVQNALLESMEIPYQIIDSSSDDFEKIIEEMVGKAKELKNPVALIIRKDTFESYALKSELANKYDLKRERAIEIILDKFKNGEIIVSTTGMISREVFEVREKKSQGHECDFMTVGSMGHASQIALGISLKSVKTVVCIDGDGSSIMHLGGLAIAGSYAGKNFIHIVLNNGAHDSVGGQPTIGYKLSLVNIATACGYYKPVSLSSESELLEFFNKVDLNSGPLFIEVRVAKGARKDLGRPTSPPWKNKSDFMQNLS